jgi:GPH family glycoside/pentoside/hexuronide:cation symporter
MRTTVSTGSLPTSVKAGWASGVLGSGTMLVLTNVLLLFFLVSHVGLSPAVAGLILLATRLYDMVSDVALGVLIDRIPTRWGRRRPWMFLGAIVSTLATFALFNVPEFGSQTMTAAYVTGTLIVFYTGYTLFTIPHTALSAEMTDDYTERTSLMAFRTLFSTGSGLAAYVGAPWLIAYLGGDRAAYGTTAGLFSGVVLLAFLSAVYFTKRVRTIPVESTMLSVRDALAVVLQNRPYLLLLGVKLCLYTALSVVGATQMFAVKYLLGRSEAFFGTMSLVAYIVVLAAIPVWTRIANQYGKSTALMWSIGPYALSHLSWLLATPAEPTSISLLRMGVAGIGVCALTLCGYAMLPDTIDYDYRRSGRQRGGIMAGVFAFIEKTGFALGPAICGFILQASGFVSGRDVAQSADAVDAVRWCIAVGPALMSLLVLPLLIAYRRHEPDMRQQQVAAEAGADDRATVPPSASTSPVGR